ncbi:hypothetical protein ACFSHP_20860 [Novosphingobium panipatense]
MSARFADNLESFLMRFGAGEILGCQKRFPQGKSQPGEGLPRAMAKFREDREAHGARRAAVSRRRVGQGGETGEPGMKARVGERMTFLPQSDHQAGFQKFTGENAPCR